MRNWKNISLIALQNDEGLLTQFYNDFKEAFGEPCRQCKGKLRSYFIQLTQKPNTMNTRTCIMKPNINVYVRSRHIHVNEKNITDEVAREMLEANPKAIKFFIRAPDDLSESEKAEEAETEQTDTEGANESETASEQSEDGFRDELIALPSIGEATADKIIADYPNKDILTAALNAKELEYSGGVMDAIISYCS